MGELQVKNSKIYEIKGKEVMKKLWSHVTKCQKLFVVTLVLAGILWMTGFNPADSGAELREVEAATIRHSGKDGNLNWSIDDEGRFLIEGDGDYVSRNWISYRNDIKTAVVKVKNSSSLYMMLAGCENLESVDLSELDTSKVTNMSHMFFGCENLESVNLSELDTSKVTNMEDLFSNCKSLKRVNLSELNTSKVTNMGYMFNWCENLTSVDLSGLDTSGVTSIKGLFQNCKKLENINFDKFSTSNITDMGMMFDGCSSLKNLDLSIFDTSNVINMSGMFDRCENLTELDLSNFNTSKVTNMENMFHRCEKLRKINLSNFDTSSVTSMGMMFEGCTSLENVDLSRFNTSEVTDVGAMFYECKSLTDVDISNFDASKIGYMGYMFTRCENLKSLNMSGLDASKVTTMEGMLAGCKNLEKLNISNLKTSDVTNMNAVFYKCAKLKSIDLSSFDISKVTNIDSMLAGCTNLESINTPVNSDTEKGSLPETENMQWEDESGKVYSCLPGNIEHSIVLTRKVPQVELKSEFITLEKTAYEYTGTPIQPTVIVKDASEKVLTEDTDYTVSYENNTNAGTATVTVTGKGNYTGTVSVEFTINPKVLTLKDEDVTIDNNGFACDGNVYEYTGEEIKPVLTINGLTKGTDYELSYKNNVEEGTATVTANCKGNYSGEYIYEYTIVKEPIFTWDKDICTSDAGEPEVTVKERTNPNCAKVGRILYIATLEHMGKVYTSENEVQLPATGKHSWDKGVVKGSKLIYTCKVCKQTQSVERKVKSIAIAGLSHNIAAGKKVALTVTVLPANAINKKVVWTTSNKKVATVSQRGIVSVLKNTGKKSVIITATAADGSRVKQSFKITSMKGVVTKVSLSGKNTLAVGKSQKVKATVKASAGAYKSLKWTSSNVKYATVSSNGTVKAQKAGKGKKVTITAMALDGSGKKATFSIKIK